MTGSATLQGQTGSLPGVVFASSSCQPPASPLLLRQQGLSLARTWSLTHALLCFPKFSSLLHPHTSTSVRALASKQALAPCTLAPRIRGTCCASLTRCFCVSSQMRLGPPYGSTLTARNSPTGTVRMQRGPVILLFLWGIFRAADFGSKRPQLLLRLATSWKLPLHWQMRLILGAGSLIQTGALAAFLHQPFMQQCRGRVTVGW